MSTELIDPYNRLCNAGILFSEETAEKGKPVYVAATNADLTTVDDLEEVMDETFILRALHGCTITKDQMEALCAKGTMVLETKVLTIIGAWVGEGTSSHPVVRALEAASGIAFKFLRLLQTDGTVFYEEEVPQEAEEA